MQQFCPRDGHAPKQLWQRLDRVFAEMNVILLALAIGLAVLDITCFSALGLNDALSLPHTTPAIERALLSLPSGASAEPGGSPMRAAN
jgi:hypothetical protein